MKYLMEPDELNQTLDAMITPMMLTDEAGTPVYINRAFTAQIGYPLYQVPDSDNWFTKAFPDQDYRKKIRQSWFFALAAGISVPVTSKIYCADGVFRWFDVYQHTIGNKYAITFLNVDALKLQAEELIDDLRQKDSLLAIIAHDIRSPMTYIKLLANERDFLTLTESEVREVFFKMCNQADYILNILESLLMRTGGERGRFTEQSESINVKDFFSKYQRYYEQQLRKQRIRLVLEFPEDALLNYDPGILDIVCRNLLDNAIKYTSKKGIISVSFMKTLTHAQILIRDTGPGMPDEQVERINKNTSSQEFYKNIADGFGLGLILAKEMLEKYRGELQVTSEMGIGTSFIIKIIEYPPGQVPALDDIT